MTNDRPAVVVIASAVILGLVVGIPYYSLPFFYDYFEHPVANGGFGWTRASIVLGLPLGTLVTLVMGPMLIHRVPPRSGVIFGAGLCAAAIAGFGVMQSLAGYYGLWMLYMCGWTVAGPMAHQILLARVLQRNRGTGFAVSLFGISAFGAISVACLARPLTAMFGFHQALIVLGLLMMLAVPLAWKALPQVGTASPSHSSSPVPNVIGSGVFWRLMTGSTLTAAGIAGISQHLKLILRERGYSEQARLDEVFGWTVMLMLGFSALGRFVFAWSADRVPKRHVITVAFLCMVCSAPLLFWVDASRTPYLFGALFGFGMSSDSLIVALLAAEHFGPSGMAKAMSVLVPVNTIGQTWFPYVVSLLWEISGSYTISLAVIFVLILCGRLLLAGACDVKEASYAESV